MKKLIKICWRVGTFSLACILLMPVFCLAITLDKNEIPVTCKASAVQALDAFFAGREAFEMGRVIEANNFFNKAILEDPQFAMVYLYKAYCSRSESEWKMNINLAEQNKKLVSEGERILIEMESTFSIKNGKERLALAKHLVELFPLSARARLILAGEYQIRKEFTRFRELTRDAIQLDSKSPLGYRSMAASYLLNEPRDFELAQNCMEKYTELYPNEAISHIALCDVYRARVVWDLAIKAYDEAILLDPKNDISYAKRGYVNIYHGDFENARKDWEMVNKLYLIEFI